MSDYNCRECGEETNAPPDDAPPDWHGLCPHCAFKLLRDGLISSPDVGFLLNALKATMENALVAIAVEVEDDTPNPREKMDLVMLDGTQIVYVHSKEQCAEAHDVDYCPFHNPSDHHMKTWPMHGNGGLKLPLIERVCPHNATHPDPDSLAWALKRDPEFNPYHGACDGCCRPDA